MTPDGPDRERRRPWGVLLLTAPPFLLAAWVSWAAVGYQRTTPLAGVRVESAPWRAGAELAASPAWLEERAEPRQLVWSGDVALDETVLLPPGSSLSIAPGTRIVLAAGVSILVAGRLEALGRPDAPIVVEPADAARPWGSLALHGPGADGSRIAHASFRGGGGARMGRVEYKGMVSVRGALGVVIERSRFDVGAGDGLELRGADALVAGNTVRDCASAGVSVSAGASPVLLDDEIAGCAVGLAVADGARPLVLHCAVTGNASGVRASAGARPRLVRTLLCGNPQDLALEPDARATLHQSVIGAPDLTQPASATAAGLLDWLTGPHGLAHNRAVAGRVPSWVRRAPSAVIDAGDFDGDPATPLRGWFRQWGVRRVAVRGGELVARVRGRARLALEREWDLTDSTRGYALVLELAGSELASVRACLLPATDPTRAPVPCSLGASAKECAYTVLDLAPGRYAGFSLEAHSAGREGELVLAGWNLVETEAVPR
jgi:hypothetical protein